MRPQRTEEGLNQYIVSFPRRASCCGGSGGSPRPVPVRVQAEKAVESAAAEGHTSAVVDLLHGHLDEAWWPSLAVRALNRAVFSRQWSTIAAVAELLSERS